MRSNKEIVKAMKEEIQFAYYRYYSMQNRMNNAENEEERQKSNSRMEKRGISADELVRSYSKLLKTLGINEKLDVYQLMELALDEVRELDKPFQAV